MLELISIQVLPGTQGNRMSKPQIRKAQLGDEEGIHKSHMRSIREVCSEHHTPDEIRGWGNRELGERWTNAIKEGHVWVVELEGTIQGHGFLRIKDVNGEKHGFIHGLYLTPEILNQGIGAKIMGLMLDKAKTEKVKTLTLESTITAHEFYKRHGFQDQGEMIKHTVNGSEVRCFPMIYRDPI